MKRRNGEKWSGLIHVSHYEDWKPTKMVNPKGKVNLSLYLTKHHAMKTCG